MLGALKGLKEGLVVGIRSVQGRRGGLGGGMRRGEEGRGGR